MRKMSQDNKSDAHGSVLVEHRRKEQFAVRVRRLPEPYEVLAIVVGKTYRVSGGGHQHARDNLWGAGMVRDTTARGA